MSGWLPEEQQFFDQAVERFKETRRTFTERAALGTAWAAGYGLSLEYDERFAKAQSRNGQYDPHYRLREHRLANQRLFNDRLDSVWDGLDLDGRLAVLDATEGGHHIFYPHDQRLVQNRQGRWEAAVEKNITLSSAQKKELDALQPALLSAWAEAGNQPWTLLHVLSALKELGWSGADQSDVIRVIRAWFLATAEIIRVGQDFWLPVHQLPEPVTRTRLQVSPLRTPIAPETQTPANVSSDNGLPVFIGYEQPESRDALLTPPGILIGGDATKLSVTFSVTLRTVNVLEGFLSVPSAVRDAYPPAAPGTTVHTLIDAVWYEDGEHFWLWLNRQQHRLYGPGLLSKIEWSSPGDILRILWAPDILTLTLAGHNEQVQREETRLIDVEALKALRGGSGESYRRSIQEILIAAPNGRTWREIVSALSERQQHTVHRGTVLALLYNGGFVQQNKRWFAAPDSTVGQRSLRSAMIETLVVPPESTTDHKLPSGEYIRTRASAIQQRLREISRQL